jgi:hypothetical protein
MPAQYGDRIRCNTPALFTDSRNLSPPLTLFIADFYTQTGKQNARTRPQGYSQYPQENPVRSFYFTDYAMERRQAERII